MSTYVTSISSPIRELLELTIRTLLSQQEIVIPLVLEHGLEEIVILGKDSLKKSKCKLRGTHNFIDVPVQFNKKIELASQIIGRFEFIVVNLAVELGCKKILKDPGLYISPRYLEAVAKKQKLPKAPKTVFIRPKAPEYVAPKKLPPVKAAAPAPKAAETPPPPTKPAPPPPSPAPAQKAPVMVAFPQKTMKEMLHIFSCSKCGADIEVPHSEYESLKRGLAAAKLRRPKCKKHGGYEHLLKPSRALGKMAS